MAMGLTEREAECLRVIRAHITATGGTPPSYGEIAEALGLSSKSGVTRLVGALVERGHVERLPGRARSIALVHSVPPSPSLDALLATLPPTVAFKLSIHCERTGEQPEDVWADSLALHFDELERIASREAGASDADPFIRLGQTREVRGTVDATTQRGDDDGAR